MQIKCKVMVLGGEERLGRAICVDGVRLEQVSEFKYFKYQVQMMPSVVGRWRVKGKLRVPSDPRLMLGVCSLIVQGLCMKHCSYLFL